MKFTEEERGVIAHYAGEDFEDRETIKEDILYASFDKEWSLSNFIDILQAAYDRLTPTERKSAFARYETGYYDSGDAFRVSYIRAETDDEYAKRMAEMKHYAAEAKSRRRSMFEELKSEFAD